MIPATTWAPLDRKEPFYTRHTQDLCLEGFKAESGLHSEQIMIAGQMNKTDGRRRPR